MDEISHFLKRFHSYNEVDDVFTRGCCYWFAIILFFRFESKKPEIMYDDIANHFGTRVGDRVFDITGDVTSEYQWKPWSEMDDELHRSRIERDCINF